MSNKGQGVELKFSLSSTYEAFTKKWGDLISEKLGWLETWSQDLSDYDHVTIGEVTKFCLENMVRSPSLPEFRVLCERKVKGAAMGEPIVSPQEAVARRILSFCKTELSEFPKEIVSDALLIAAAILVLKQHKASGLSWDEAHVNLALAGRAQMFGLASLGWCKELEQGKGFWLNELSET